MRKRYRVLFLAAVVAAVAVPFGFALSLETPIPVQDALPVATAVTTTDRAPDAAKLLLVGTTLFGLAAFVRRSL